ncbi:carbamoyl phosphate synthase-like protein [Oleiphilus messinensis]|uniref:Carbamoyl phosphate synthase-like protein n=1 Tax=Oleiphilus messinensis TaxID=141451 RepID=A0A1Y0IGE1_9GAMM|nr:ATP-grasp domain-containing protein [Oleiphilus messinensis]ARU59562.1 carbamoyl phosphate synthase-like protein [Oleiphilus messinensis]
MSRHTAIAVTGTGSLIGQAIIKSILRSDLCDEIELVGMDYFEQTVGSYWTEKNYLLPDILNPDVEEQSWLNSIISILSENAVKLLFIGVDFELPLFARYKSMIEEETGARLMVCSSQVIEIANDKYLTYQFLKENGLPHPRSFLPGELDFANLDYPLIVKPRKGARSVGLHKVSCEAELKTALHRVDDPIIQECVGTDDDEYTCGTIFLDDRLQKSIVLKRSLKEGNTYISHFKNDFPTRITEYLEAVANCLKPYGACNFQLRLDPDGTPKIFEINARHSGTTYIRSLFGYKEVEYIVNHLLFEKAISFDLREGTVIRYYEESLVQ